MIRNTPGLPGCRYSLLPPESSRSEVLMEAVVKVEGPAGQPVAFMAVSYLGVEVQIAPDGIGTRPGVDFQKKMDMTTYRTVRLYHKEGWLRVSVDGQVLIHQCIFREDAPPGGWYGNGPLHSFTQFGEVGDAGRSFWKSFKYEARNPSIGDCRWEWHAAAGQWPDQYQRDRLIQIHANELTESHSPDHGYSSWLPLPDGRIIFVDYTNYGDKPSKSHLVGVYLEAEDLQ